MCIRDRYIGNILHLQGGDSAIGLNIAELLFSVLLIVIMMIKEFRVQGYRMESDKKFYIYTAAMVSLCYIFGVFSENQFIYFQF